MGALAGLDLSRSRFRPPQAPKALPPALEVDHSAKAKLRALLDTALEKRSPQTYAEIRRICALPVVHPLTPEEADAISRNEVLAEAYAEGFRLRGQQAASLLAFDHYTGPFCPISVGGGKTLVSIMIAERYARGGGERSVLLVPPAVYGQLVGSDISWARKKVPLTVPFHYMQRSQRKRLDLAASGWRGCYIFPYSLLSVKDTSQLLEQIKPGLIIADEAHNLRHRGSAKTRRVMEFIDEHEPKLVLMSGTITGKGIRDYWHLISPCLRENSPLPLSSQLADDWGEVLDAREQAPSKSAGRVLLPLIEWAQEHFPDEEEQLEETVGGFRAAYRLRLTSAPGVVTTTESALGTTLVIHNEPAPLDEREPSTAAMLEHLRKIDNEGLTPNGDEIEYAIHAYKWRYELSSGFYNRLFWPEPGTKPHITAEILERSQEYHARLNAYHGTPEIGLRDWLKENARAGLDTPMLVGASMARRGSKDVGEGLYGLWRAMKDADFEGRIERDSEAVRVCDYKIKRVVQWAKTLPKGAGALVWHWHKAIGRWLHEALLEAGFDALLCPAGENERVLDPKNAKKILIVSISAHGTGKNLQHFQYQIAPQWPRGAIAAEQMLGRTHRPGQQADELIFERCDTLPFDYQNFAACLNDSIYIHQSTGNQQKLVYAVYDPLPKVYPDEWLRERGFQAKRLTAEQRRLRDERFGSVTTEA
ncbi:MAG: hypothetical protein LC123_02480 [Burkholderiales bacterium]|nr:hypothetical protein [Burkholderiales bacterium]